MAKLDKMARFIPALYRPDSNPLIRGLLHSWSGEDDLITTSIEDAKEQIFVETAQAQYLNSLGSNVGVFRPLTVNLTDDQFRTLIPLLSFRPKQVRVIIKDVLDFFFGVGNPNVSINEINPNEIAIQIPNTVPSFKRGLKGSIHLHVYSGVIVAVDNVLKTITIDIENATKALQMDELSQGFIGQGNTQLTPILSNGPGTLGVVLQSPVTTDLSGFIVGGRFRMYLKNYPGSFLPDKRRDFTATRTRTTINQNIVAGSIYPTLLCQNVSQFPDQLGYVIFAYGAKTQEIVKYIKRPNNSTLLLDATYSFLFNHSIGDTVNLGIKPYVVPRASGGDYSAYVTGVTAARELAQEIVQSLVASGVVIRWIIPEVKC